MHREATPKFLHLKRRAAARMRRFVCRGSINLNEQRLSFPASKTLCVQAVLKMTNSQLILVHTLQECARIEKTCALVGVVAFSTSLIDRLHDSEIVLGLRTFTCAFSRSLHGLLYMLLFSTWLSLHSLVFPRPLDGAMVMVLRLFRCLHQLSRLKVRRLKNKNSRFSDLFHSGFHHST